MKRCRIRRSDQALSRRLPMRTSRHRIRGASPERAILQRMTLVRAALKPRMPAALRATFAQPTIVRSHLSFAGVECPKPTAMATPRLTVSTLVRATRRKRPRGTVAAGKTSRTRMATRRPIASMNAPGIRQRSRVGCAAAASPKSTTMETARPTASSRATPSPDQVAEPRLNYPHRHEGCGTCRHT